MSDTLEDLKARLATTPVAGHIEARRYLKRRIARLEARRGREDAAPLAPLVSTPSGSDTT